MALSFATDFENWNTCVFEIFCVKYAFVKERSTMNENHVLSLFSEENIAEKKINFIYKYAAFCSFRFTY